MKVYNIFLKHLLLISWLFSFSIYAAQNNAATNVANELNSLYKRTADCDNSEPNYYCSGVILRGQRFTDKIAEPWYMNPIRDNASFSYIRSDITAHKGFSLYYTSSTGFILTPLDEVESDNQYQYEPMCYYPYDGFTITGKTCKEASQNGIGTCDELGIVTVNQFLERYRYTNPDSFLPGQPSTHTCAFGVDYNGFKLGTSVEKYIYRDHPEVGIVEDEYSMVYNELLIRSWPKNTVSANKIPLKAIFIMINDGGQYSDDSDDAPDAATSAFQTADAYKKATNKDLPVVTLDMKKLQSGATDIFASAVRPNNTLRK